MSGLSYGVKAKSPSSGHFVTDTFDTVLPDVKHFLQHSLTKRTASTFSRIGPFIPGDNYHWYGICLFGVPFFGNHIIDDCAKDGGEEFFTEMHCVL